MKKSILVTGIAGSGKTTVANELRAMGHEAVDIEEVDGMFAMYRKGTNELFEDYDNADPEKIRNAAWLCDVTQLKALLREQRADVAFYGGVASNMDEVMPLFDTVLLLQADVNTLHSRLSNREGTDDIGNTEAGRQAVLAWKDWFENDMINKGAVVISASGGPHEVAERIAQYAGITR